MAVEAPRSCGYRKVGGLYLCGEGYGLPCDRLSFRIENCPVCGSGLAFTRAWTWLDWLKYAGKHENCKEATGKIENYWVPCCPVCDPHVFTMPYGLLWVGEKYYSPEAFVRESMQMGVSRRLPYRGDIPRAPRLLNLGETWVLFAHKHVIYVGKDEKNEDVWEPAIFHAFRPTRLELLVWQKDATQERLEELTKAGITPVIIPNGDKDHDSDTPIGLAANDKEELENMMLFSDMRRRLVK